MIADGLSRIAMSSGLAASLSRATDYARAHGHAEVTLEHMLLALCDDPTRSWCWRPATSTSRS